MLTEKVRPAMPTRSPHVQLNIQTHKTIISHSLGTICQSSHSLPTGQLQTFLFNRSYSASHKHTTQTCGSHLAQKPQVRKYFVTTLQHGFQGPHQGHVHYKSYLTKGSPKYGVPSSIYSSLSVLSVQTIHQSEFTFPISNVAWDHFDTKHLYLFTGTHS